MSPTYFALKKPHASFANYTKSGVKSELPTVAPERLGRKTGLTRILVTGLISVLSVTVAACANQSDIKPNETGPDSPNSKSGVVAEKPEPTSEPLPHALTFEAHEKYGISVDTKQTRKRGDGSKYNPLIISEDSPGLQLENAEVYDKESEDRLYANFSPEEIQAAIVQLGQFSLTDILDSEASYSHDLSANRANFEHLRDRLTEESQETWETNQKFHLFSNMKLDSIKPLGVNLYKAEGDNSPNMSVAEVRVGNLGSDEYGRLHFTVRILADAVLDYRNPETGLLENITRARLLQDRTFFLEFTDSGEWKINGVKAVDDLISQVNWDLIDGQHDQLSETAEVIAPLSDGLDWPLGVLKGSTDDPLDFVTVQN